MAYDYEHCKMRRISATGTFLARPFSRFLGIGSGIAVRQSVFSACFVVISLAPFFSICALILLRVARETKRGYTYIYRLDAS